MKIKERIIERSEVKHRESVEQVSMALRYEDVSQKMVVSALISMFMSVPYRHLQVEVDDEASNHF